MCFLNELNLEGSFLHEYADLIGNFTIVDQWTFYDNASNQEIDSNCFAPYQILGGYNNLDGQSSIKTEMFSNFPHYQISFRVQLYIIGQGNVAIQYRVNNVTTCL